MERPLPPPPLGGGGLERSLSSTIGGSAVAFFFAFFQAAFELIEIKLGDFPIPPQFGLRSGHG